MFKVRQLRLENVTFQYKKNLTEKTNENYLLQHSQSHSNMADCYSKYTRRKKKVGQLKNANISHKTFHYIFDMHIFLKLIQFPIF